MIINTEIFISDVTYMELVQGTKSKKEFRELRLMLEDIQAQTIPITADISKKAVNLVEIYSHSHDMQMADALIASTALIHKIPLSSGNRKHYEYIPELEFYPFIRQNQ